jgi:hypothetical protein
MTICEVIDYHEVAHDQRRVAARFYRRAGKVQQPRGGVPPLGT